MWLSSPALLILQSLYNHIDWYDYYLWLIPRSNCILPKHPLFVSGSFTTPFLQYLARPGIRSTSFKTLISLSEIIIGWVLKWSYAITNLLRLHRLHCWSKAEGLSQVWPVIQEVSISTFAFQHYKAEGLSQVRKLFSK